MSIAIFNDSIVEGNETFTAALSVPAAEAALGVSVSATDGTAYVEIQDDGKQNPLHMHAIVCSPLVSSRLHPDMAYITFSDMSYQVTEGNGYVTITLLVMGQVVELLQVNAYILAQFREHLHGVLACMSFCQFKCSVLFSKVVFKLLAIFLPTY